MKQRPAWNTVVLWTAGGAAVGALLACCANMIFIIPAIPGAIVASLFPDQLVFRDSGPLLDLLLPANAGAYMVAGFIASLFVIRRRRLQRHDPMRCRRCRYLLVGNTSGVCPECGTSMERDDTKR